jgi:hypothetical protein
MAVGKLLVLCGLPGTSPRSLPLGICVRVAGLTACAKTFVGMNLSNPISNKTKQAGFRLRIAEVYGNFRDAAVNEFAGKRSPRPNMLARLRYVLGL